MHVNIKDPKTGKIESILCVERISNTCIILQLGKEDDLEALVQIAKSMSCDHITLLVLAEQVIPEGWEKEDVCVLRKTLTS